MSRQQTRYHQAVDDFKRSLLAEALTAHAGNRTQAARALGLQRTYFLRLLHDFGLNGAASGQTASLRPVTEGRANP